jgi:hypothetical protein
MFVVVNCKHPTRCHAHRRPDPGGDIASDPVLAEAFGRKTAEVVETFTTSKVML